MTIRTGLLVALVLTSVASTATDFEGVTNPARAQTDYMLNCQGCHGANGLGNKTAGVPRMNNYVGNFLKVPGGREYLVQVPGSANAAISDERLAELLNWMLPTLSETEMPDDFEPYSAAEITELRMQPKEEIVRLRSELVALIEAL